MFSSVSHALHWAFLLDNGAPLEVHGRRAHIACGTETRTIDIGDATETDLRVACAAALTQARAALTPLQWAALCARFGHRGTRADGFAALLDLCEPAAGRALSADAMALFTDKPAETAGARLLSGVRAALVAHALACLPTGFLADQLAPAA